LDNGGVHQNSGVANKAAYLITDGDTFNGYTITGLGISKTADLFYEAQTNILTSSANYNSLYAALNQACSTLNYSADECLQVNNAGLATEMNLTPCSTTTPCADSSAISVNTPVTGSLASTDCLSTERSGSYQDVMTFTATAGAQYVITQNSTAFDSYLYLLNGTAVVASNDDESNGNRNSKIIYTATASGTLTIHATSYYASVTGAYTLAVSAVSTAPVAPSVLTASAVSSSQINLAWTDNSSNETGFKVERGSSKKGPWMLMVTTAASVVSYQDTGLVTGRTYYYRVRATNAVGDSANTSVMNAKTLAIAPAAPTALTTSAVSSSQINLAWTDMSNNETGFKIERSTSTAGPWTLMPTTAANVVSYQDTGLAAGSTYYYQVRATNADGDSANTSVMSATTLAIASTAPNAPTTLTATAISSSQINLAWTDNSNNETGFKVERSSSTTGPWTLMATTTANVVSYQDTGLVAGSTYYYQVRATNADGDSANTSAMSATTLASAPTTPSTLTATAFSSSQINLAWTDNSNNETGFKIERSTSATGPWTLITTTTANVVSYQDTGLVAGSTYYYQMRATNAGGDSANTSVISATTLAIAPTAPSALMAIEVSSSQINLGWTDASSNETGFKVERGSSKKGPWTLMATTTVNVVSYQDTDLVASSTYYYRVRATNAGGDSANTSVISATTLAIAPTAPTELTLIASSSSKINLAWMDNSNNETGFKVERSISATGDWTLMATRSAGVVSYQDTGLAAASTYYYRVRATNAGGDSANTSVMSATTLAIAPVAPTALTATPVSSSQINLTWTNNSNNETGFKVERGSSKKGPWILMATTAASVVSYQDTGLAAGRTYYYRVRATNAVGDSANTSVMSAKL
jgi:titin